MILSVYNFCKKHEIIKIGNWTRKKLQLLSQVLELFCCWLYNDSFENVSLVAIRLVQCKLALSDQLLWLILSFKLMIAILLFFFLFTLGTWLPTDLTVWLLFICLRANDRQPAFNLSLYSELWVPLEPIPMVSVGVSRVWIASFKPVCFVAIVLQVSDCRFCGTSLFCCYWLFFE